MGGGQAASRRDAFLGVGEGPDCSDLLLGLMQALGGDHLAPNGPRVINGGSPLGEQLTDRAALVVAHQPDGIPVVSCREQRPQCLDLAVKAGHISNTGAGQTGPQQRVHLGQAHPPQVLQLVGEHDVIGPSAGNLPEGGVGFREPVSGAPDAHPHPAAGSGEPAAYLQERLETRFVVGHVDHDRR